MPKNQSSTETIAQHSHPHPSVMHNPPRQRGARIQQAGWVETLGATGRTAPLAWTLGLPTFLIEEAAPYVQKLNGSYHPEVMAID